MVRRPPSTHAYFLAIVIVAIPLMARAQGPATDSPATETPGSGAAATESPSATAAPQIDVSYVTPNAAFVLHAHPRRVFTDPQFSALPLGEMYKPIRDTFGFDPPDVDTLLLVIEPRGMDVPHLGAVVRLTKPLALDTLLNKVLSTTEADELAGRPYRRAKNERANPSIGSIDDRTLIIGNDDLLRAMLANHDKPQSGQVSKLLSEADLSQDVVAIFSLDVIQPIIRPLLAQAPPPPEPYGKYMAVFDLVSSARLDLNLVNQAESQLVVQAINEDGAQRLQYLAEDGIELAREKFEEEMKNASGRLDNERQQQELKLAKSIADQIFDILDPESEGRQLTLARLEAKDSERTIAGIVALVTPAVQAARQSARRSQSMNNLKQIALAMLNNESANGHYPARAIFDKQGKPLLSWRVQVLPFLEEKELYDKFHLDEPWDSPHNMKLIAEMPDVYRSPNSKAEDGKTTYLVPVGKDTVFEGQKGTKIQQITDGTSMTILVLEVDDDHAVPWTKPDDLQIDLKKPLKGLGHSQPEGGFNAAFCDGSVHFLLKTIDADVFRLLLQKSDGQVIQYDQF